MRMTSNSRRNGVGQSLLAGVAALGLSSAAASGAVAQELSDKSVQSIIDYAWSLTPQQFTRPDGRTITVDKKKKAEVVVPVDVAREVIKVGYRSGWAQICELSTDQIDNRNSLMKREQDKKKWTEQQLLYINQVHLATVMMLTGQFKLVEQQGDKQVVVEESKTHQKTCPADQKAKVKEQIAAYVKSGPVITPATIVSGGPDAPATGSTAPAAPATPAAQKK
jgi:hypothetical protein